MLKNNELKISLWLSSLFALRMIGLFMILPVFTIYAEQLRGNTPILAGIAIGSYGFSQAIFQIPFGMLSDHYGRKKILYVGLLIFLIGSFIAALSQSIWGVILGRILQGSGAIASVIMALAADLTCEENRTKVMAIIGITIGISFAVSMITGPMLISVIGLAGMFWTNGILALLSIGIVKYLLPDPLAMTQYNNKLVSGKFKILFKRQLIQLYFSIFALHILLVTTFIAIPLTLEKIGILSREHWLLYLPTLIGSFVITAFCVVFAEKYQQVKLIIVCSVIAIVLAELLFLRTHNNFVSFLIPLLLFFSAFNTLEAIFPSLLAKVIPVASKGTAMGIYSSSQFLGAFIGGVLGGVLRGSYGVNSIFLSATCFAFFWLVIVSTMLRPVYLHSYIISVGYLNEEAATILTSQLYMVQGVQEAVVIPQEGIAYLKIDQDKLDKIALSKYCYDTNTAA